MRNLLKKTCTNLMLFFLIFIHKEINGSIDCCNTSSIRNLTITSQFIFDEESEIVKQPGYLSGTFIFNDDFPLSSDVILGKDIRLVTNDYKIIGNGYSMILDRDLIVDDNEILYFTDNTIIDGQGHNLTLGHRAQILVDTTSTLTLRNLTLKNHLNTTSEPAIKCLDSSGIIALDNVEFALNSDFDFSNGQMFIYNDFIFSGTSQFSYKTPKASYITPQSTFYINKGTIFEYAPSTADKTLIKMQDDSSEFYFDGCTLKSTHTGLQLTTGKVLFDNKVNVISTSQAASNSIIFQDLTNSIEPNASVKITQGGKVLLDGLMSIINGGISGGFVFNSTEGFALNDDTYLDSSAYFTEGGTIDGNGYVLYLEDDLNIANESTLIFTDNTIIDGQGHNLTLGHRAQILVDTTSTLTLRNLTLKNHLNTTSKPAIKCLDSSGIIALDNVEFALNSDFDFSNGQMFIYNDFIFSGTSQFSYKTPKASYITPQSTFYINKGTIFEYAPSTADKTLIKMQDDSSEFYFDGCTLKSTHTGLQLTTGKVLFDNKVNVISTSQAASNSIIFQDLTNSIEPNASVKITQGGKVLLDGLMSIINGGISGGFVFNSTEGFTLNDDTYLDSSAYFTEGGTIDGNGYVLYLEDDLNIANESTLIFTGNTIIDGQGHNLTLKHRAQILVDTNTTLTLRNLTLNNTLNTIAQPAVKCLDWYGKLALDNVELALNDDFSFYSGQMFIHNDVIFTGTSQFIYRGVRPSYIAPQSQLYIDKGTSFDYSPSSTDKTLIKMNDTTSVLYFDGCTLKSTFTGLQLTTGNVYFDNKVNVTTAAALEISGLDTITTASLNREATSGSWSPDGLFFAACGNNSQTNNQLAVYSFDSSSLTKITSVDISISSDNTILSTDWSPDGKYIAIVGRFYQLIVYSFDGSTLTQVASAVISSGGWITANDVKWSPNGKYIAIAQGHSVKDIIVYLFDGSSLIEKAFAGGNPGVAYDVDWTPDGNYLAAIGRQVIGTGDELVVFSFDGSSLTAIVNIPLIGNQGKIVSWSPDGLHLAIGYIATNDIIIYSFNGSSLNPEASTPFGTFVKSINWSPDGKYIAVAGNNNPKDFSIYSFNGSTLTEEASSDFGTKADFASWSPDGVYIAVGGIKTPANNITIFKPIFGPDTQTQAASNSIVFQDLQNGIEPDASIHVLGGTRIVLDGIMHL